MFLNAIKLRAMFFMMGAVGLLMWFVMGGPGVLNQTHITIHYGVEPNFAGLPVEIDGAVAGTLTPLGQNPTTGFEVKPGAHTIRILHPTLVCQPHDVIVERGDTKHLMMEIGESMSADGSAGAAITFRS